MPALSRSRTLSETLPATSEVYRTFKSHCPEATEASVQKIVEALVRTATELGVPEEKIMELLANRPRKQPKAERLGVR